MAAPLREVTVPAKDAQLHIVYRDAWFGSANLVGVSSNPYRALIRLDGQSPPRVIFDLVDLEHGQRVDRWEVPQGAAARMAKGESPFASSEQGSSEDAELTTTLTRLADLVAPFGPWHMRRGMAWPPFAVSHDRATLLFGARQTDGSPDWLMGKTVTAAGARRIDEGLRASYAPVFSPSGEHIAFRGCNISPCDYGLFVTRLGGKPARIAGIRQASAPVFDKTGSTILIVGEQQNDRPGKKCLFAVTVASSRVKTLHCMAGVRDVAFVQDDDGRTGVLSGTRGEAGKQDVVFTWLLIEEGNLLATHTVERASGYGPLSNSGLLILPTQRGGAKLVDLVGDRSATLSERIGWFTGFEAARWVRDEVPLVRKPEGAKHFELVVIRGRAILP